MVTLYSNRTSPNMQRLQEVAKAEQRLSTLRLICLRALPFAGVESSATPRSFEARGLPGEVEQPQPH